MQDFLAADAMDTTYFAEDSYVGTLSIRVVLSCLRMGISLNRCCFQVLTFELNTSFNSKRFSKVERCFTIHTCCVNCN
jgi:hypothetical protein